MEGAASKTQCLPCPSGYFNSKPGASTCTPCDRSESCPIASTSPNQFPTEINATAVRVRQPIVTDTTETDERYMTLILVSGGVLNVLLLVVPAFIFLRLQWLNSRWVSFLDVLYAERHNRKLGTMRKK